MADYIDPSKYSSADDLYAAVLEADWESFKEDDMPYILQYAEDVTNGKGITDAVASARDNSERGIAQASGASERQTAGLGLALTAAQQANRAADLKRTGTAAMVSSMNDAKVAAQDDQLAALSGSYTGT